MYTNVYVVLQGKYAINAKKYKTEECFEFLLIAHQLLLWLLLLLRNHMPRELLP